LKGGSYGLSETVINIVAAEMNKRYEQHKIRVEKKGEIVISGRRSREVKSDMQYVFEKIKEMNLPDSWKLVLDTLQSDKQ